MSPLLDISQLCCQWHVCHTILPRTVCLCLHEWNGCILLQAHSFGTYGSSTKREQSESHSYLQPLRSFLPTCLCHTYLIPLLVIPLLKVDSLRGKSHNRFLFLVKQLNMDLIFTGTIPPWCVPDETKETDIGLNRVKLPEYIYHSN